MRASGPAASHIWTKDLEQPEAQQARVKLEVAREEMALGRYPAEFTMW